MSKVLIIDRCDKCPCYITAHILDWTCMGHTCLFDGVEPLDDKFPDNCPLPDLPERKEEMEYLAVGWNACLDAIKEEEEKR